MATSGKKTRQDRSGQRAKPQTYKKDFMEAEPFAELNVNPTWSTYTGECFLKCHFHFQKQYI